MQASSLTLGKAFGADCTALDALGGKSFNYLSERYLLGSVGKEASLAMKARWASFFRDVAQASISFQVSSSQLRAGEQNKLTVADRNALPSGTLPKLRMRNPAHASSPLRQAARRCRQRRKPRRDP